MSDKKITELPDGGAVQSTDEFVAARAGGNVKIAGSALVGSLPAVETDTYTIGSPTYVHEQVFDLGGGGILSYKATGIVLTPDGEVFGTADGNIGVDVSAQVSLDGVAWEVSPLSPPTPVDANDLDANFYISQVGQFYGGNSFTWRYYKIIQSIRVESTDTIYAGPNSPSAEITLVVAPLELWG